jgi:hypothetical protein
VTEPDIEIGAVVKARKLRFKTVPKTEVRAGGRHAEGGSNTERENLPEQVEPGVTYRDVTVRWRAAARLDEVADEADRRPAE